MNCMTPVIGAFVEAVAVIVAAASRPLAIACRGVVGADGSAGVAGALAVKVIMVGAAVYGFGVIGGVDLVVVAVLGDAASPGFCC